jgi:hypothetical protein
VQAVKTLCGEADGLRLDDREINAVASWLLGRGRKVAQGEHETCQRQTRDAYKSTDCHAISSLSGARESGPDCRTLYIPSGVGARQNDAEAFISKST